MKLASIARFFRRSKRDAESARDLQFYLDTETEDNIARGMPPAEARAAARRKLGNPTLLREEIYHMHSLGVLETIWQDLRYSWRTLRQSPSFTLTAVITLALGIGANTAMFSVVRAVLLTPLEYHDPDRLVYFSMENPPKDARDITFSLPQFQEMKAAAKSFAGMGAYGHPENITLSGIGEPEVLKGARVSANFLDVLGLPPTLGRSFLPEEDQRGGRPVAMISSALWKRKFGGDPLAIGKAITLDATSYTIIGVLPPNFEFPFGSDIWLTRPSEWSMLPPRYWATITVLSGFARLKPQVTLQQARAEMRVLYRQYVAAHPNPTNADPGLAMRTDLLKDRLTARARPMLWTLFGAVGFVLLIACANVASLLLARSTARSREFSLRAALGAGRGRLIRQLLAESLLLATAGGALGLLVAKCGMSALTRVNSVFLRTGPESLFVPGMRDIQLDGLVLGFSVMLSIATGVLFGLFPSLQVSRPDLASMLRESGASAGHASRRRLFGVTTRGLLVVSQIALSIVLLIGASLLIQSFARLHGVDPGFQPAHVLVAKIPLPLAHYDTDLKKSAFFRDLLPRLENLPGVSGAAIAQSIPTTRLIGTNIFAVEGGPPPDHNDPAYQAAWQSVSPTYFHTLGIPLKRGRAFTERDNTPGAPPVAIVNERLARHIWPGTNPIGRHFKEGYDKSVGWIEVVGVVADIHESGLDADAHTEFYIPPALHPPQTAYLILSTKGDPLRFANIIRSQVLAVDPNQPVSDVQTLESVLAATLGQRRLTMILLGSFAGMALLLALIGIYGIIAYSVAQRTQEVGIRRALGAHQSDILRLVLQQGLVLTLLGGALGIGGAFALTRIMKGLLFGVSATDPATFAGIALLFVAVALVASYIPARRAAQIDPMAALRT
ncbi:MAG TPA: ABC transporter permease [Bryobacteraceae bacterium]|jgi:predicted permease